LRKYSITLILQDQRGSLFFLAVDLGYPIIHHQLLDERVFCGFGTHSVRSRAGYPLKNATANLRFPKFAETPCNVSVSKHTSTIGRKMMPQKSTATFTQLQ
jgi:hypothetical protein